MTARTVSHYGSFERVLTLPPGARPEDVSAHYADGVLTVTMPRASEPERHVVAVTRPEGDADGDAG